MAEGLIGIMVAADVVGHEVEGTCHGVREVAEAEVDKAIMASQNPTDTNPI